jgi:hypothetical protein
MVVGPRAAALAASVAVSIDERRRVPGSVACHRSSRIRPDTATRADVGAAAEECCSSFSCSPQSSRHTSMSFRSGTRKRTCIAELFFYVTFANADNDRIRKLFREHALVATKQHERNGCTLDLYTFRFAFAS